MGISGAYVPENIFDGEPANADLLTRTQRAGMICTMSHGWNRGGEGIINQPQILRDIDDRWPASIGVAACTAFALGDQCNMGQAWLRKGAIFACGTAISANNNARVPLQVNQLEKRVSVGEAVNSMVVQYGDPSLHVLPPAGTPVTALQIQPSLGGHYEERSLEAGRPLQPVTQTYTLTNRSSANMAISAECDAAWIQLTPSKVSLKPGETATVTATSTDRMAKMAPANHVARIRFTRADGQRDERRIGVKLKPVSLQMAFSFDATVENNRFPDVALATQPKNAWHDGTSLWLVAAEKGPHWKPTVKLGNKIEGFAAEPEGKVGGALRLSKPAKPWSRGINGFVQWRGVSASFWFKVDALPDAKKKANISTAPFALTVDSNGALTFAKGGKAADLGTVKVGTWHFVQLRTDVATKSVECRMDGNNEVTTDAKIAATDAMTLGSFAGALDEVKVWSGELSDAAVATEWTIASQPFQRPASVAAAEYLDDGVFRAPKEIPAVFDLANANARLDLAKILTDNQLTCTLREAPEWLEFKDGALALKAGVDFDRIDFGGYDLALVLKSSAGRVCEHPLKVRIPVPAVNIRLNRAPDGTVSFTNRGDQFGKADRPLAKGVIRYTTDGSPVKATSAVYTQPFKAAEGMKIAARFFYLGEYPMAPVTSNTEFGISRELWKALAVSGQAATLPAAANALDAKPETAWVNKGGALPQFLAWDMGEAATLTALSCQSTIKDQTGRIKDYVLHASDDGKTWRKVSAGALENSPNAQRVKFAAALTARYLKLEVASLHAGKDAVVAELECFTK